MLWHMHGVFLCVAVCCSVLQCVAVCVAVCVVVCSSLLQCAAVSVFWHMCFSIHMCTHNSVILCTLKVSTE